MGLPISKASNGHAHTESHAHSKSAKSSQEIEYWEETYRERFARKVTVTGFRNPDSNTDQWLTFDPLWGFFEKPVVLKLAPEDVERQIRLTYPISNCPPRYLGPTPEPLSAGLRARTRQELIHTYDWKLAMNTRSRVRLWDCKGFKIGGTTAKPSVVSYLNHGDQVPPGLLCKRFLGINILSKIAAVYFEPGFMRCWEGQCWENDGDAYMDLCYGLGCAYIARALLAAVKEVNHHNGELANRQQFRWLANSFALEGLPGTGGATKAAVRTHKIICEELQNVQNKAVSSEDPYTWVEHGFEMGPIYRSLIIIVDRQLALKRGEDDVELCDILFERCSVLLVRTGDEDHLSAPIDLSALSSAGLTLPLDRGEEAFIDPGEMQQVVRVRLRTAVRFVMDLERREVNASPRLTARKRFLDADMLREAEIWADGAIDHAERNGSIDRDVDTWAAVRRAQAHLNGDRCGLEIGSFHPQSLRYW